MYKPLLKTRFIGKNIQYVTTCHSTNDIAAYKVRSGSAIHGEIVIAGEQTAGRGQRGRNWLADKDQNFTFSIILFPSELEVKNQFYLAQVVALGVRKYVADRVSKPVYIKWPNDIFIGPNKTAGILIENTLRGHRIQSSVVGIGLNVNQQRFDTERTTSLALELGNTLQLGEELEKLQLCLEMYFSLLEQGDYRQLKELYLNEALGVGEERRFLTSIGPLTGKIADVTPEGKLVLSKGGETFAFGAQEISWIWED